MEKLTLDSPLIIGCVDRENGIEEARGRRRRRETLDEVKKQFWLAGPLIGASLLQKVLQLISVMFVGHLGELSLAGASMATSFAGVTGFSLLLGMGSALETLCGQSFGAQQYNVLGIHMQNAMLVLTLVSIPVAVLWCYTSQILLALGQDLEISLEAGLYARWLIPALFAYGLLQCQTRFLQTQNIVFPLLCASGVTTLLHILVCWLLVFKSGLGTKGAALGNSISYWINVLFLSLFIKLSPSCKKTWDGFSKKIFSGSLDFIKLAIPSVSMVCLEYWSFELLVLLSGLLPNSILETSVLSICLNTASLLFMIPYGLGAAISTRVSNELGARRAQAARLAVRVVVLLAIFESLIVGMILVLMRNIWGYAYNHEDEVVKYVAIMVPVLAVSNVFDGIQCVLSGTARGCGLQKACAFANLGAYYVVGIPSAVLFAFAFHIGGMGLWMGIICGLIVQVLLLLSITLSIDWEKELGMGIALESLCGQAFGAKQYHMLGVHLQKAMVVLTVSSIPVAVIWFFTGRILVVFHQDPEISQKAQVYARWMLPSLFAFGLVQCQIRFLQAQNIVLPLMLSSGATAMLHTLLSWVLVYKTRLGYVGAALSASFSYWFIVVLLALYIKFSPACRSTWTGFSKNAFHGITSFVKLAIPSALMICMEYWSFEAIVILSGLLPNPKLETSTMSTCLNTSTTLYMITFGIGAAISTRVSNELGAGNARATKMAIYITLVIATVEGLVMATVIILMRNIWGEAVNKDKQVINYVASLMPYIATIHFIDAYQCVLSGIVRGCGWQKICAIVNLGSYYGVGLPISILLAFKHHMGGKGLWVGIVCALTAQVLLLGIVAISNNWEKEARKAIERTQDFVPVADVQDQSLPHNLYNSELWNRELEFEEPHGNGR